ncbi:hypothetical protein vseg_021648 [Gypsophila vaccaria]
MDSVQRRDNNEKAELEEIMSTEVAKSLIMEAEGRHQAGVVGAIGNNRGQTLQLLATTHWTGNFHTAPPASVGVGGRAQFSHNGSKGALIYGQQQGSSNAVAYLLVWSMGNGPLRVYVKCGPVSQVHHNGWESTALASLNSSGANSSFRHDGTSSTAQASIRDESGLYPLGVIIANFN